MNRWDKIIIIINDCLQKCNSLCTPSLDRSKWFFRFVTLLEEQTDLPLTVIKNFRWEFDSVIFYLPEGIFTDQAIAIKIHDELFPIASNILDNPILLKKMEAAGEIAVKILTTFLINNENPIPMRVIIYEYICGIDALQYIQSNGHRIYDIISAFEICIKGLLAIGIHPYLKDLSDFIISESNEGIIKVRLVDLNAAIDISKSSTYSRTGIMSFLHPVIVRFVDIKKPPYSGVMESLK